MSNVNIMIATHKKYNFPEDIIYTPIHVGKEGKESLDFQGDNTGDNISSKNSTFCELTGIYWAWKNGFFNNVKYCGLVHYRRYFNGDGCVMNLKYPIMNEKDVLAYFKDFDIIMPKKRKYYIDTIESHYTHSHNIMDLYETKKIVSEMFPEYDPAFEEILKERSLHLFNMFVLPVNRFNDYCAWLFPILFELEKRINIAEYDNYQKRVFGFISERLLNVWVRHNRLKIKHVAVCNVDGEIFYKKVVGLLKRKFFNQKHI